MQHQSFAAKQWIGKSSSNLNSFLDLMSRRIKIFSLLPLLALGSLFQPLRAQGLLFTLRNGSFLSSEPSYDSKTRMSLAIDDVLVESPPLEEKGEFCHYRLLDGEERPLETKTAWTPCFSVDRLFIRP